MPPSSNEASSSGSSEPYSSSSISSSGPSSSSSSAIGGVFSTLLFFDPVFAASPLLTAATLVSLFAAALPLPAALPALSDLAGVLLLALPATARGGDAPSKSSLPSFSSESPHSVPESSAASASARLRTAALVRVGRGSEVFPSGDLASDLASGVFAF